MNWADIELKKVAKRMDRESDGRNDDDGFMLVYSELDKRGWAESSGGEFGWRGIVIVVL